MSKSTNTVVYFDWKTVVYIYVCGQCRTQFMLPHSSRRQFINMYIYDENVSHMNLRMCWWNYTQSINRSFVYKAKEGRRVRMWGMPWCPLKIYIILVIFTLRESCWLFLFCFVLFFAFCLFFVVVFLCVLFVCLSASLFLFYFFSFFLFLFYTRII